jgi:hypothetical protein
MSTAVSPIVSVSEILAAVAAGRITPERAAELIPFPQRGGRLWCKVSPKRAISIYGLQRMPVTLYVEQWERLLDFGDEIRKFAGEKNGELNRKARG